MIGTKVICHKSMRSLALAGVSTFILTAVSPASAQTPANKANAAVSEEIIVTARKREESIMKAPVLIQAITAKQIEDLHLTKIESLATAAPGTFINYGFGATGITAYMRGLGNSPQATIVDQTVSVNIDGYTSATGALFRSGIFDAAQIEVLKGPQSLFFGKSTAAGVIAITSADPTPEWDSKMTIGYEFNADEIDVNGYVSGPLSDNLGIRIAGYHRSSKGYLYDPTQKVRLPAEDDDGGRITLKYDNSDVGLRMKLKVAYTNVNANASVFSRNQRACAGPTSPATFAPLDNCIVDTITQGTPLGLPYNPNHNKSLTNPTDWATSTPHPLFRDGKPYSQTKTALSTLNIDYDVMDGLTLTSLTAWTYIKTLDSGVNPFILGYIDIAGVVKVHDISEEVRLTSNWKDSWINFIVGGLYNSNIKKDMTVLSFRNNAVASQSRLYRANKPNVTTENKGAFGQIILTPIEQWELTAGVRYTEVTKDITSILVDNNSGGLASTYGEQLQAIPLNLRSYSENATTPEVTLSYKPTNDFTAFVSYKRGYKGPAYGAFSNIYPVNATTVAGQAPIKGEKAEGVEGGVKAKLFDNQVALTATGYLYKYKDLQVSFILPGEAAARIVNAGATRVQGIELGVDYSPVDVPGLVVNAFMNYNDSHYTDFAGGTCYLGQTVALGCVGGKADLTGRTLSMAPKWAGYAGARYTWDLNDEYTASIHAQVQYSSSYLSSAQLDPFGRQGSYALINAGVRLGRTDNSWELALLCRDCNNKIYAVNGTDGGTIPHSVFVNVARPRQVLLQLTVKPNLL